jgi:IS30 family transposase
MYRQKKTQQEIADEVKVSQACISKELSRNRNSHEHYVADDAQMFAEDRKARYKRKRTFTKEIEDFIIRQMTKYQWSPDEISGYCKKHSIAMVSVERIYQYIREDKANGGTLYLNCRHKLKHRKRSLYNDAGVAHIPNRTSIHDRPPEIESREEFGHWEMDLIQNGDDFILTIVERTTRYLLMSRLLNGKNANDVANNVIKLLIPHKKYIKSITTDNGGEFAYHEIIAKKLKTKIYFTDPYSSWQKGSIENMNKLIRQYIPKKESIKNLNYDHLLAIQNKINHRPRKILNYTAPTFVFYNFAS